MFSVEKNLDKVDRKDDGDQLVECDTLILSCHECKVTLNDIRDLSFIEFENFLKNLSDLVKLEKLILIGIISEEDLSELVDDDPSEALKSVQIFIFFQELFIVSRYSNFDFFFFVALRKRSEIVFHEEEVDNVSDPAVFIKIDF